MIVLFYNCWSNPTGAAVFTEHLYKLLTGAGEEVRVCAVRAKASKPKPIMKFGGIMVENITIEEAIELGTENPALMTHAMRGGIEEKLCAQLIETTGIPFISHGPRGVLDSQFKAAKISGSTIVFIRAATEKFFHSKYGDDIKTVYLRHPYIRGTKIASYNKIHNAVSISRIAREKNTDIVVRANELLPENKKIDIFGSISDRIYSYFDLDKKFPDWRKNYFGEQQRNNVDSFNLCRNSNFTVDMSTFKVEGGGTQYTFLEAMDAGCCLVLHSDWLKYEGEMIEGYSCISVSNETELAKLVQKKPILLPGYEEILEMHSMESVKQEWMDLF